MLCQFWIFNIDIKWIPKYWTISSKCYLNQCCRLDMAWYILLCIFTFFPARRLGVLYRNIQSRSVLTKFQWMSARPDHIGSSTSPPTEEVQIEETADLRACSVLEVFNKLALIHYIKHLRLFVYLFRIARNNWRLAMNTRLQGVDVALPLPWNYSLATS